MVVSYCFNGAAFLRTRNPSAALISPTGSSALQWGRVLTNAESQRRCGAAHCAREASMGPRSYERGIHRWVIQLYVAAPRFNGAAFLRTRNLGSAPAQVPCIPCFNGAAFLRTRNRIGPCGQWTIGAASMGPRSYERGIPMAPTHLEASEVWLQWGRVLTNAESSRIVSHDNADGIASMGPRSYERGIDDDAEYALTPYQASMGPRSYERGIHSRGGEVQAMLDGFNGAAFLRTRNRHYRKQHKRCSECFNGAAFLRTRNPRSDLFIDRCR